MSVVSSTTVDIYSAVDIYTAAVYLNHIVRAASCDSSSGIKGCTAVNLSCISPIAIQFIDREESVTLDERPSSLKIRILRTEEVIPDLEASASQLNFPPAM